MASTVYHNDQSEQAGIEVVQNYESGLQATNPDQQWQYPVQTEQGEKGIPQAGVVANESVSPPPSKKIKKIILIALACTIVLVGVIVGAVVGTKNRSSSPTSSPEDKSGQGGQAQDGEGVGSSGAEMTGSPTSVAPGLSPTAISWGYPHLEIFALTNNDTDPIYRKYRNSNATSESDFLPRGREMELVGGLVDTNSAPSVAVNHRITDGSNQTEIYINGKGNAYRKYHVADELWNMISPDDWYYFGNDYVVGSPAQVQYDTSFEALKVFYLSNGDSGLAAHYFQWHPEDGWSNLIEVPGPDLQPMTPSVIAWNGNDSRLDIFAVSRANSHLLHASWDSEAAKWSDYEDLRGFVTTPPVAVSRTPGVIDVFARGGDAGLWHLSYNDGNGTWSSWTRISGDMKVQGQPDAISATSDSVDVFALREDGSMLHKTFDSVSNSWTPANDFEVLINGSLAGPPRAVSDGSGSIHVFAYSYQNQLIWKRLSPEGQSSETTTLADVPMVS